MKECGNSVRYSRAISFKPRNCSPKRSNSVFPRNKWFEYECKEMVNDPPSIKV